MREDLKLTLKYYCNNSLNSFKNSQLYLNLLNLTTQLGYVIDCAAENNQDDLRNYYLSFNIIDKTGNSVVSGEYDDYVTINYAILIIKIDRKERIKFFSWEEDEDFIDSVNWAIRELQAKSKL